MPVPRRAVLPVAGAVVTLAVWAAVAHSSGAGWVQALGALLAGFLIVGFVGPGLAVARVRCRVTANPADATAGQAVTIEVRIDRGAPARIRPLEPPCAGNPRTAAEGVVGRSGQVVLVPRRRGVVDRCRLEIGSAAPFGLLWWSRRVVVELARPLHVGPTVGEPDEDLVTDEAGGPSQARFRVHEVGEPRGARPYQPGDRRNLVHWPASAHTSSLMVREMEAASAPPRIVDALLPADPDQADRRAERALGTVVKLLSAGNHVQLLTFEDDGLHREQVETPLVAARRLARARSGP